MGIIKCGNARNFSGKVTRWIWWVGRFYSASSLLPYLDGMSVWENLGHLNPVPVFNATCTDERSGKIGNMDKQKNKKSRRFLMMTSIPFEMFVIIFGGFKLGVWLDGKIS